MGEEILGLDDILGALTDDVMGDEVVMGNDDILGALLSGDLRATTPGGQQAIKQFVRSRKMRGANVLTRKDPSFSGMVPLGMVSGGVSPATVAVAASVDIATAPQMAFRPLRVTVPETIAPFFVINNILVGTRNQLPSTYPIPCEMFIPAAEDVDMLFETVSPAINFSMNVTNIGGAAIIFRAGIKGKAVG